MSCGSIAAYAIFLVPDVDYDDVRRGQSITLLAGLSVALAARLLSLVFI